MRNSIPMILSVFLFFNVLSCKKENKINENCRLEQLRFDLYDGHEVFTFWYDPHGRLNRLQYERFGQYGSDGYIEDVYYDAQGCLTKTVSETFGGAAANKQTWFEEFAYNDSGRIARSYSYRDTITKDTVGNFRYYFDSQNRMIQKNEFVIEYDSQGNFSRQYVLRDNSRILRFESISHDQKSNFYKFTDDITRFIMANRERIEYLPLIQYSRNNVLGYKVYDSNGNALRTDSFTYQYENDIPVNRFFPRAGFNNVFAYSCK